MEPSIDKITKAALNFLEPLSPDDTYAIIVQEACKLVGGQTGYIAVEKKGKLELTYAPSINVRSIKIRKAGYTYFSYSKRKAFVVYAKEFIKVHPELVDMGVQSAILIPLFYKNKGLGALAVFSTNKETNFTNIELEILKLFGSMATLSIRKAQLYQEISQALKYRDTFLSMAAHEFRTPITSINGYAQLLQSRIPKDGSAISRWIDGLSSESLRLNLLLNELLNIEQIKSGQLTYHWKHTRLSEIINRAIANFQFTNPEREIIFDDFLDKQSDMVVADFDKLLQVLNNLLENSAKFSKDTTPIMVNLNSDRRHLLIKIQDFGLGMDPQDAKKIFRQYYRGKTDKEGMGLGLYIAKEVIEKHKGKLSLKSKVNQGTIMTISLPKLNNAQIKN